MCYNPLPHSPSQLDPVIMQPWHPVSPKPVSVQHCLTQTVSENGTQYPLWQSCDHNRCQLWYWCRNSFASGIFRVQVKRLSFCVQKTSLICSRLSLVARNKAALERVREECLTAGAKEVLVLSHDVGAEEQCQSLVDKTVEHFGGRMRNKSYNTSNFTRD